jgi:hypothetical protein
MRRDVDTCVEIQGPGSYAAMLGGELSLQKARAASKKQKLRRERNGKIAELDALVKQHLGRTAIACRGGRAPNGRSLHLVLEDAIKLIGTMRVAKYSAACNQAGMADLKVEDEIDSAEDAEVWATTIQPDDAARPNGLSPRREIVTLRHSAPLFKVDVNAEMRAGLLSSQWFMCIEVEHSLGQDHCSDDLQPTPPWTVVRASLGAHALFEFAPWGKLTGKDFLQIIHPSDVADFLSLARQTRGGLQTDQVAIIRILNFFDHRFSSDVEDDQAEPGIEMDLPRDPFFEDPLLEHDKHDTALSAAQVTNDSRNSVFTSSNYQTMCVWLGNSPASGAAPSAASGAALLVLKHVDPRDNLPDPPMVRTSHPCDVAVESINEVLEAMQIVNGIYCLDTEASSDTIGAVRSSVSMDVSPVTREHLNYVERMTKRIGRWCQKGVVSLSNAVYRMAQIHVDFCVGSNRVPAVNVHARLCFFGLYTSDWKFLGHQPLDGSAVPFQNGPEGTLQACTWALGEPEDEAGRSIGFSRFVMVPATSKPASFFSRTILLSQKGIMTERGMLDGRMYSLVFNKVGEVDLVLCCSNDDRTPGMSYP